jgi:hypothetical protein
LKTERVKVVDLTSCDVEYSEQLDSALATVGPWAGMVLIIGGVLLCLIGIKVMRLLIALAVFIPFSGTTYVVVTMMLEQPQQWGIILAILAGAVAATAAAILYSRLHVLLGGVLGMVLMALVVSYVDSFYSLELLHMAIAVDAGFIIGALALRSWQETVQVLAPSTLGALMLTVGVHIRTVGFDALLEFNLSEGRSAIIFWVAMFGGAFVQVFLFGKKDEDGNRRKGGLRIPPLRRPNAPPPPVQEGPQQQRQPQHPRKRTE